MNLATETMRKMTKMLGAIDQKYKEFATEPYGITKLSLKEQRERYERLTPDGLLDLIEEKGIDEVNKFLQRFEGGKNA